MWDEEISDAIDWLEDTLEGMNKVKEADRPNKVRGDDMWNCLFICTISRIHGFYARRFNTYYIYI